MPWLSVLVPVYNGAATLAESLGSLVGQAEGVEVLLVDQGSKDDSRAIAESFADRLDLTIIDAPENRNWVQNTNLALSRAQAPHATMLHQDDLWRPGRAALLRRMIDRAPDAALYLHAADYIDANGRTVGQFAPGFSATPRSLTSEDALARLLVQNTVALPAAAFPTEIAREAGGLDQSLWYTADWDFWLKLTRRGPVHWSPERRAAFRLHGGSQTVTGSRDLDDFAAQLATPLERHLTALPARLRAPVRKRAEASNALNLWMAARFHGTPRPTRPLLAQLAALGPTNWGPFWRDARVFQRVLPRLRLRR
ncbi:glycosyltransferase family 2 protein [Litorisediminicola beolgyonensis]|uniref:Glycosyltransferase family 2 protein n=1 Tax=Litorisediminicola beolgyonensis TaxID=1173614 RepID=A0ABW3ZJH7_9RHOB